MKDQTGTLRRKVWFINEALIIFIWLWGISDKKESQSRLVVPKNLGDWAEVDLAKMG